MQQGFPELRQSFVVKSLYFSLGNFRAVLELLLRLVPAQGVRSGDAPAASCRLLPSPDPLGRLLPVGPRLVHQPAAVLPVEHQAGAPQQHRALLNINKYFSIEKIFLK